MKRTYLVTKKIDAMNCDYIKQVYAMHGVQLLYVDNVLFTDLSQFDKMNVATENVDYSFNVDDVESATSARDYVDYVFEKFVELTDNEEDEEDEE